MTKSKSQTSAGAPDDIHVEGDVGDHASFIYFNTGWVLPKGSKRNRTAVANPEMIGKVPRKISAPESPAPTEGSKTTGQTAAAKPQQRPRSRTVPSSSRQSESAPAAARTKRQSSARRGSEPKQESRDEPEVNTAASSPLTSDDEGDKDTEPATRGKQTRSNAQRRGKQVTLPRVPLKLPPARQPLHHVAALARALHRSNPDFAFSIETCANRFKIVGRLCNQSSAIRHKGVGEDGRVRSLPRRNRDQQG